MKTIVVRSIKSLGLIILTAVFVFQVFGEDMLESRLYVPEAKQPDGFPKAGKIGEIVVKSYPAYRAAVVNRAEAGQDQMFRTLFNHIQKNEIKMTAPVEMTFDDKGERSMAFLYRNPELGKVGTDGVVQVVDVTAVDVVSIAVRGDYTKENWEQSLAKLENWLGNQEAWESTGPARYLGFNSPFVPKSLRYGEVQIPIRKRS